MASRKKASAKQRKRTGRRRGARETRAFVRQGPPPNLHHRTLFFDSLVKIISDTTDSSKQALSVGEEEEQGICVFSWGAGFHGQLGRKLRRGEKKYTATPVLVKMPHPTLQISCGGVHTAAATEKGHVWTWGDGRHGQLGHSNDKFTIQPTPQLVLPLQKHFITRVACGRFHTLVLSSKGKIWSWGLSKFGQCGHGDRMQQKTPRRVEAGKVVFTSISAGDKHSSALSEDGLAYVWGSGEHGQTGQGDADDRLVPTSVDCGAALQQVVCGAIFTTFVSTEGEVFVCGFGEHLFPEGSQSFKFAPFPIPQKEPIKQAGCGQSHIVVLAESGSVYAWGNGEFGQVGHGVRGSVDTPWLVLNKKNIAEVTCGRYHSFALTSFGVLYSWGCGENGQLGHARKDLQRVSDELETWKQEFREMQRTQQLAEQQGGQAGLKSIATHRLLLTEIERDMKRGAMSPRDMDEKTFQPQPTPPSRREKEKEKEKPELFPQIPSGKLQIKIGEPLSPVSPRARAYSNRSASSSVSGGSPRIPISPRGNFMKETATQMNRIRAIVSKRGEKETMSKFRMAHSTAVDMRKEWDKLRHISRSKKSQLENQKKESKMTEKRIRVMKKDHKQSFARFTDLQMRLKGVTLKIQEAEDNRKNYELGIGHLKEQEFDNITSLDGLRQQVAENNNLLAKANEMKIVALEERENAEQSLLLFKNEIKNYQSFVTTQLRRFGEVLDTTQAEVQKREQQRKVLRKARQAKQVERLVVLEERAKKKKEEEKTLSKELEKIEADLKKYEERFQLIRDATGLTDVEEIINKFQFKNEIREQLKTEIEQKKKGIEDAKSRVELLRQQIELKRRGVRDDRWRDVEAKEEVLRELDVRTTAEQAEHERIRQRLVLAQEGLQNLYEIVSKRKGKQAKQLEATDAVWSAEDCNAFIGILEKEISELRS